MNGTGKGVPNVEFLSTPSARRATSNELQQRRSNSISIHALREEGDFAENGGYCLPVNISIHALREEGDWAK